MINSILKLFFQKKSAKKSMARVSYIPNRHHNLQMIFEEVNARYFEGKVAVTISWSGRGTLPKTHITFGSYHFEHNHIRINRLLDSEQIPDYVVQFIVYHEILHHLFPPMRKRGKRAVHHEDFKKKEKQFQDYALAKDFIKKWSKDIFQKSSLKN